MERRSIDLGSGPVPYELRRSDRARWPRLEVHVRTGLRVVVPARMPEGDIAPFVRGRASWILRHLRRAASWRERFPDRPLVHGGFVSFRGAELRLDLGPGPTKVGRLGDSLIVTVPTPASERSVRRALEAWMRGQALEIIPSRARQLAARHRVEVSRVVVRDQKTRWGSCSSNGTLSFNWRMVMAPSEVLDYLICHELAHRAEPNHSKRFWARVGNLDPRWREAEAWLKRRGPGLAL